MSSVDKTKNAVRMTEGPIAKQIIAFALPIFLGNLFQQLYNTVDSLIVGNFVGEEALAAVSSSGSMIFMITGFIFGVFSGAGVVIAQYFGAGDEENVNRAVHTTVALGIIAGFLVMIIGLVLTPQILRWIDTPENVLPNSILYFRIFFLGSVFSTLYNTSSGIFQAVGDSRHPVYYLVISSICNVVLDLLFVAVFKWGIAGAAIATVCAQFISFALAFGRLTSNRVEEIYRVKISKIHINGYMMSKILRIGIPSGVQNSVIGLANIVVQANINAFGDLAMAGCGSYSKLEGFAFLPITSFAMALTTFTGQNTGAGKMKRVKRGAVIGCLGAMVCAEIIGIIMYTLSPVMIAWFSQNAEVVTYGVRQAHIEALFYFLLAFSHAAAGLMRGAGKAIVPMIVMLTFWCVIRVIYITVVTGIIPSIAVIFWAYPLTWSLSSITYLIYILSGKWLKGMKVKEA